MTIESFTSIDLDLQNEETKLLLQNVQESLSELREKMKFESNLLTENHQEIDKGKLEEVFKLEEDPVKRVLMARVLFDKQGYQRVFENELHNTKLKIKALHNPRFCIRCSELIQQMITGDDVNFRLEFATSEHMACLDKKMWSFFVDEDNPSVLEALAQNIYYYFDAPLEHFRNLYLSPFPNVRKALTGKLWGAARHHPKQAKALLFDSDDQVRKAAWDSPIPILLNFVSS